MTALLVGETDAAAGLPEALRAAGVEASVDGPGDPEAEGEIATLARELLRFESRLREAPPSAVLLTDRGDTALAAALVATKLLIPVAAVGDEREGDQNSAVLAQLVDRKLSADSGEIRTWIEGLPTLSGP
jgi:hypothetical protein